MMWNELKMLMQDYIGKYESMKVKYINYVIKKYCSYCSKLFGLQWMFYQTDMPRTVYVTENRIIDKGYLVRLLQFFKILL